MEEDDDAVFTNFGTIEDIKHRLAAEKSFPQVALDDCTSFEVISKDFINFVHEQGLPPSSISAELTRPYALKQVTYRGTLYLVTGENK